LERIYEAFQKTDFADAKPGNTVLIAPSWGKKNILESVGEQLVELLIHAGYRVIVRPHPETVKRTPEFIERIQRRFDNHEALTIELSVATNESLFKADVLISDYSGVSLEYALGTNRPVLFLEVPLKINNDRYKDLDMPLFELEARSQIGMVLSPDDLDNVPATIELLKAERSTYQERISQLRDEYVYHFGRSSKIGAEHIMKLLHNTPEQG
jgi:YidC/Oxa1 family membrane protein insertase